MPTFSTDENLITTFQNQRYQINLLQTVGIERKFIQLQSDLLFDLDNERWSRDLDADPVNMAWVPISHATGCRIGPIESPNIVIIR